MENKGLLCALGTLLSSIINQITKDDISLVTSVVVGIFAIRYYIIAARRKKEK